MGNGTAAPVAEITPEVVFNATKSIIGNWGGVKPEDTLLHFLEAGWECNLTTVALLILAKKKNFMPESVFACAPALSCRADRLEAPLKTAGFNPGRFNYAKQLATEGKAPELNPERVAAILAKLGK